MEYWEMEKGFFMTHRVFGVYETRLWRKWVCMGKTKMEEIRKNYFKTEGLK
jgi:hypothetical protein